MDEIFGTPPAGYGFTPDDIFRDRKGWALPHFGGTKIHGGGDDEVSLAVRQLRDAVLAEVPGDADQQKLIEPLREAIRLLRMSGPAAREGASQMLEQFVHRSKMYKKSQGIEIMGGKHQSRAHEIRSLLVDLNDHSAAAIARGGRLSPR